MVTAQHMGVCVAAQVQEWQHCMRAGTYTPIAVVGLGGGLGATLLRRVWAGAFAGVLQSAFWPKAPKAFATSIYIALGWTILPHVKEVLVCQPLSEAKGQPCRSGR